MKKITKLLLVSVLVLCLPLSAWAVEKNFAAGSLIIPLDSIYQPEADGGTLEAYGLIFNLLSYTYPDGHRMTVYWIINEQKVAVDGTDFIIDDQSLTVGAVAAEYDHNNGTTAITYKTGDSANHMTYLGGPFVIDKVDADVAKVIINNSSWAAVNVHEAMVPFNAPVYRQMNGTPPRIALMDSDESGTGNAEILESYLRLAGICTDVYDILTPNEIRDGKLMLPITNGAGQKIDLDGNVTTDPNKYVYYSFLWAPHWAGYEKYPHVDVEEIVRQVRIFLEAGNGALAECASIEVFEHSENGRFLTTKGFGHNGGWDDPAHIIYNDITTPNAQAGDFAYEPTGGHLHNWRPYNFNDDSGLNEPVTGMKLEYMKNKGLVPSPQNWPAPDTVTSLVNSVYNDTVTRFTIDDAGWDYYVGGYVDGEVSKGYIVYLGGHKYASCSTSGGGAVAVCTNEPQHRLEVTFAQNLTNEIFNLSGDTAAASAAINFAADGEPFDILDGTPLKVAVDIQTTVNNNVISNILFENLDVGNLTGTDLNLTWLGDTDSDGQYITQVKDLTTGAILYSWFPGGGGGGGLSGWIPKDPDEVDGNDSNEYKIEMDRGITDEQFTLTVYHSGGSSTLVFNGSDLGSNIKVGWPIEIDLSNAELKDGKKMEKLNFNNKTGSPIEIYGYTLSWTGGVSDQVIKKGERKQPDKIGYKQGEIPGVVIAPVVGTPEPTTITLDTKFDIAEPCPFVDPGAIGGCTDNGDCAPSNVSAVRYVLNTLFNIKYQLISIEYVRSAPIVDYPDLFQGSFEYPSYRGHLRRYDVTLKSDAAATWDAADLVPSPGTGNADGRKIYTAVDGYGSKTNFDEANIDVLRVPLNVAPLPVQAPADGGDDSAEIDVVTRVRGHYWDPDYVDPVTLIKTGTWVELSNKLGAIEHSSPAFVYGNSAIADRRLMLYVGSLDGMLHGIDFDTGIEQWAFIPRNLLGKLQNDRTDENAPNDFAAVDASPTVKDVYYDHDNDGAKTWRTILVNAEGWGGNYIFALDITDPDNMVPLWEATDIEENPPLVPPEPRGGGMGSAYRVAIDKIKVPVTITDPIDGTEIDTYESRYIAVVATGYRDFVDSHGGVNVYAYDLFSGQRLWYFTEPYVDAVNDIPGAVTMFDANQDGYADFTYVGDMNGRMWELNAVDGSNPNGSQTVSDGNGGTVERQIPLWNAGVGFPISVSPAIGFIDGDVGVVFGTGGTDWSADDSQYSVFVINATVKQEVPSYDSGAGTLMWQYVLPVGEKVWSSATMVGGTIFLSTSKGTMESGDPAKDIDGAGTLWQFQAGGDQAGDVLDTLNVGQTRGSLYVDQQHLYMTDTSGNIIEVGDGNYNNLGLNWVFLRSWRSLNSTSQSDIDIVEQSGIVWEDIDNM